MHDIDRLSRRVPVLCKVAPSVADVHLEDVHRAGGVMAILGELDRAGLINRELPTVHSAIARGCARPLGHQAHQERKRPAPSIKAAPGRRADPGRVQPGAPLRGRSTPTAAPAPSAMPRMPFPRTAAWRCCPATSPLDGCIVKTAGVDDSILKFDGPGAGLRKPGRRGRRHPRRQDQSRRRRGDPLRRPARRPGHAGDALSDQLPEIEGAGQSLRPDHRRPLLRRHLGPVDRPCLAGSGGGRPDRAGRRRRPHRDRHSGPLDPASLVDDASIDAAPRGHAGPRRAWKPAKRSRKVSMALKAYAALTTSAARGAVRVVKD